MKKTVLSTLLLAAFAATAGDPTDTTVYFKTTGPDCYQDGNPALPGEFYALVWSAKGSDFYGFNADASLVSNGVNSLIVMYPKAKAKTNAPNHIYLPKQGVDLTVDQTKTYGQYGTLHVVLLDTRKTSDALCDRIDIGDSLFKPALVNGYQSVASVTTELAVVAGTCGIDSPITISKTSGIPADAPRPVITNIALREGPSGQEMVLTVRGTADYLRYTAGNAKSAACEKVTGSTTEYGKKNSTDTITIVVPAKDNMGLFRIIRN